MRFTEIANADEKLALWKLVSDKMWAAFGQQAQQHSNPMATQQLATSTPKVTAKPISRVSAKPLGKGKATPVKAHKPKKVPMAPAPKPFPKAKPLPITPTQVKQAQSQQHQQLAQHIQKALAASSPAQANPQAIQPKRATSINVPLNNSYDSRDKDELVFHSRASNNPLKPLVIKNR
jgi:hypothetical protein